MDIGSDGETEKNNKAAAKPNTDQMMTRFLPIRSDIMPPTITATVNPAAESVKKEPVWATDKPKRLRHFLEKRSHHRHLHPEY